MRSSSGSVPLRCCTIRVCVNLTKWLHKESTMKNYYYPFKVTVFWILNKMCFVFNLRHIWTYLLTLHLFLVCVWKPLSASYNFFILRHDALFFYPQRQLIWKCAMDYASSSGSKLHKEDRRVESGGRREQSEQCSRFYIDLSRLCRGISFAFQSFFPYDDEVCELTP